VSAAVVKMTAKLARCVFPPNGQVRCLTSFLSPCYGLPAPFSGPNVQIAGLKLPGGIAHPVPVDDRVAGSETMLEWWKPQLADYVGMEGPPTDPGGRPMSSAAATTMADSTVRMACERSELRPVAAPSDGLSLP